MFRHLKPILKFTLGSKSGGVKHHAQILANRAMCSSGAFEINKAEVGIWLQLVPLSDSVVLSFLCDAVDTVGRNMDKYMETLSEILQSTSQIDNNFAALQFGPFVICILDKCLRVLKSSSKNLKLFQRTGVCIYVANALGLLLQSQVHPEVLATVIDVFLSSKLEGSSINDVNFKSEWSPLQNLLLNVQHLRRHEMHIMHNNLFHFQTGSLKVVLKFCEDDMFTSIEAKALALSSCLQCIPPQELAENIPKLMEIHFSVFKGRLPVLVGLFGAYPWMFAAILKLWPDLVDKALESAFVLAQSKGDMKENTSLCQMHKLSLPKHVEPDSITKENPSDMCFSERTAFAFSVFLLSLPFTIIFPAAANCYDDKLWGSPQLYNIFLIALSEVPPLLWFPAASLILYWAEIFWERHCREDVFVKNQLEVCFALLKWMILPSETHGWLSLLQSTEEVSTNFSLVAQFLQGILMHPFMNRQFFQVAESTQYTATFESDDRSAPELGESQALEKWFQICASKSPSVYCHITLVFENLLLWASEPQRLDSLSMSKRHWQLLRRVIFFASKSFLNEICCSVKTVCSKGDQQCRLSPWFSFHLASKFSSYISFDAMVDLSCTLLSEKHINNEITTCCSSSLHMPCHIVGLYFGTLTFNRIICSFQNGKLQDSALFHNIRIQELYQKLLHIVLTAPSEMAFSCLLTALESHSRINYFSSGAWMHASSPFCDTPPMELLPSLMRDINEKKAKIILHLVQSSQCHLVQFAEELSYNLGVGGSRLLRLAPLVSGCSLVEHCPGNALYTMQDMVSILPPVNWLIDVAKHQSHIVHCKVVQQIISAYYRQILEILRDLEIFNTPLNMDEVRPYLESKDYHKKFFRYFGSTGSGQVVNMLKHCLDHNCFSNVNREIVFSSITEKSYPLIDASIRRIDELSTKETLKIANIVIAKSMAARLLFLTDMHDLNAKHTQSIAAAEDNHLAGLTGIGSTKIGSMIFDVVNILTSTLCVLFRQAPEDTGDCYGKYLDVSGVPVSISKSEVLRVVERSLLEELRTVLKATADIHFETQDLSSLRKLTKSVLKFRFGESLPMQVLRLYASKSVQVPDFARHYAEYGLKLLVAHSRFSSTLLSFSGSSMENSLLKKYISDDSKSLPSILSMMKVPYRHAAIDKPMSEVKEDAANCISKLEILKFLRLLFYLKRQVAALDVSMEQAVDHSELLSLLLASYGASLNEVDTQNFLLMQEMETFKGANYAGLAGLDYLWGEAALKWRQENMSAECALNAARFPDEGTNRELRKKCFKEGLALDLTRCALGILFFPSRRNFPFTEILDGGHELEEKTLAVQSDESLLQNSAYDPRFLLQFSLHSLSCGWINANEFVLKGLLALALMSTASAVEDMRKLGYEVLAKFLAVLEEGPSFKGKPQIRLLLIVVKNSVLEPWQRLPSSAALFAAEASCLLMTPSDVHYTIVSKFLCRAACLDVEGVPLFKSMFRSGSVYFRSDRSWILRLLVFSLRTSFDAHIYRRQFIVEILMSFYGSPLGDNHTREWILEILFRASKIRTLAQHLVEHSGMLSWLTTVVCSNGAAKSGEYVGGVSSELSFKVLQIFENLLEWRSVKRWLVSEGFEELLKMAIVLHNILVESPKFIEPAIFIEPYLRILGTAFRLSQSRRKSQSHLHLPLADLSALIECIDTQKATTHHIQMLALKTILEVQPPACSIQERNYLWKVGAWMLSVGLKNLKVWHLSLERDNSMDKKDRAITLADSKNLLATIYAWLNASLILGKSGGAFQGADTAWSFLEGIKRPEPCDSFCRSDRDKDIIQLLICQQCLLGTSVTNISAVCAVLILLPSMEGPFGTFIEDNSNFFEWPLRQLPFPSELSSSWQWRAFECTSTGSLFEYETCQMLFAMFQKLVDMKDKNKLDDLVKTLQLDLVAYARSERAGELEDVQFGPALWKDLQTVLTNPSD
ncbi:hypothetical protein KP509_09G076400 [Ceratopteris richardii]|nr:hypothetical protein KP509_09G076400 [Ceratopteris richardii]